MYTILGNDRCSSCIKSKMFLDYKKIPYKFLDVNTEMYYKEYLIPGVLEHRTIPKIIYKKKFIGGYEDLINHVEKLSKKKKKRSKRKRSKKRK